ncbi:MAG TPA: exodeoxyribonuclease VII large subunit [Gammaproteobacteria bacterium]|nr:exodeoxyribonuclease VII large subunit [Gammaproteobacteria bacterium]
METLQSTELFAPPAREVYTVSRLNREVRALLDRGFPALWLEGEISNLSRPRSGHLYFTLKDADAQLRCAMFRMRNVLLNFAPKDGMQVQLRGRVSLYEPRGDYQFIVETMEEAGDGHLRRAFEALKKRLEAEGLFDPANKKPLPDTPHRIGVITSPTGAALRDILHILRRRYPAAAVLVYPVPVQGAAAAADIARMIRLADRRQECDVLILARGGGSLEDLWAFNEEAVARAIFDCRLPLVAGVGHETDVTIADFAADRRAPTPSGAAELVSPDGAALLARLAALEMRLARRLRERLAQQARQLAFLRTRLQQQHPARRLQQHQQRLDELGGRLERAQGHLLRHARARLAAAGAALRRHTPDHRLRQSTLQLAHLRGRLRRAMTRKLDQQRSRLGSLGRALHAVSPLATLERGYAIVMRARDGQVVRSAAGVRPGEQIEARLARGHLRCTVDESVPTGAAAPEKLCRPAPSSRGRGPAPVPARTAKKGKP